MRKLTKPGAKKTTSLTQDFLFLARKRRVERRRVSLYVTERNEEDDEARGKKDKSGVVGVGGYYYSLVFFRSLGQFNPFRGIDNLRI